MHRYCGFPSSGSYISLRLRFRGHKRFLGRILCVLRSILTQIKVHLALTCFWLRGLSSAYRLCIAPQGLDNARQDAASRHGLNHGVLLLRLKNFLGLS
jgi:hypothetical protein